jgi:23S rRNA (guanosine2251-2'-O)-methyltransferase
MRPPVVLVVGSEGYGIRRLVRERCDIIVSLPMAGRIESLNAAVAGSIALYEVVRDAEDA